MPIKSKCLILFVFLIIYVNYGLAYEDNYTFELKTLTRQLPEDVWRLYTTKPDVSYLEYGSLAAASSLILLDQELYDIFHQSSLRDFHGWEVISIFGEPVLYGLLGLAYATNDHPLGEDLLYSVGFAGANTFVLKFTVGMARPYLNEGIHFIGPHLQSDYAAFPSGHTATAFSAATVFSEYYPEYAGWFWTGASLVGLSRIYLEKHWPSNVVFGAILGYLSAKHALEVRKHSKPYIHNCEVND